MSDASLFSMPVHSSPDQPVKRMPQWMRRPIAAPGRASEVERLVGDLNLNTVCRSAKCPNRGECYASGTAAFLIMGDTCTRRCSFCAVETGRPPPLDPDEPRRVAEAAGLMGLCHAVVTSVTRDDLDDGGAAHFVKTVEQVRQAVPDASIEVLTSDFAGDLRHVDSVAAARPDVFNHNVETVPRLYPQVRPEADYERSLAVLARVRETQPDLPTKSGFMVGLGETEDEVVAVLTGLRRSGVDIVTIGQYLRPSATHHPVVRFVDPSEFSRYGEIARSLGFAGVASAPFVRSSYRAADVARDVAVRAATGAPAS
jgi:lipoic acid synthetase